MLGFIVTIALLQTPTPAAGGATPAAAPAPAATTTPATAGPTVVPPAAATTPTVTATAAEPTKPAPANAPAAQPPGNPLTQFLPFLPIIVLFYFMMIRPQKQEEKKRKELLSRMQKNDKVITAGGMYGTIVAVDPETDTVTLRLGADPGVRVEFTKASVVRVLAPADKKDAG